MNTRICRTVAAFGAIAVLLLLGSGARGQGPEEKPTGYWAFVDVTEYNTPDNKVLELYPAKITGSRGELHSRHAALEKPGGKVRWSQEARWQWNDPPRALLEGQPLTVRLSRETIVNTAGSDRVSYGSIGIEITGFEADSDTRGIARFYDRTGAYRLDLKEPAKMSVDFTGKPPGEVTGTPRPNVAGRWVSLRIGVYHGCWRTFFYNYQWTEGVPPPGSTESTPGGTTTTGTDTGTSGKPETQPGSGDSRQVTPLAAKDLQASAEDQAVAVDGRIRVIVPGGLLKAPARLTIGEVVSPPAPPFDALTSAAVYDVALGALHRFDRDVRMEVPLRAEWLRPNCPPWACVAPSYYDEEAKAWVLLPYDVDAKAGVLRFTTRHLSMVAINRIGESYAVVWDEPSIRLVVLYNRSFVEAETAAFGGGDPDDTAPRRGAMPPYVRAVLNGAYNTIRRYAESGFVPTNTTMWIYVQTGVNPTHYAATGNLLIPLNQNNARDMMQTVAHEMFHNVQRREFSTPGIFIRNLITGNWWLEASAEYAASRLAIPDYERMGKRNALMPPNYLTSPLTFSPITEGPFTGHQYHGAHFLDFVVRQGQTIEATEGVAGSRGRYFKDLYDTVSLAEVAVERFDPLIPLAAFIAGRHGNLTLDETYTRFAAYYLFNAASPMTVADPAAVPTQAASNRLEVVPGQSESLLTFGMEAGHTAQLGVVTVNVPRDRTLPVSFRLVTELPDRVSAFVRVMPDSRRDRGVALGPLPADYKALSLEPVTLEAGPQDALCVLVVNNGTAHRVVGVKVQPEARRGYWRLVRADHKAEKEPESDYPNLKIKTWFDSEDGKCMGKNENSLLEKGQWRKRNLRGEVTWQPPPARVAPGATVTMNATTRIDGEPDNSNTSHIAQIRLTANMLTIRPADPLLQANAKRLTHTGAFTIAFPDLGASGKVVPLPPIRVEVVIPFGGQDAYEYRYEWVPP